MSTWTLLAAITLPFLAAVLAGLHTWFRIRVRAAIDRAADCAREAGYAEGYDQGRFDEAMDRLYPDDAEEKHHG